MKIRKRNGFTRPPFFKNLKSGAGFTILELLIFSAIFGMVAITFVAILVSVARVQVRESANAEVNRQSQFLMHVIQRNIEESSLVSINETFGGNDPGNPNDLNATSSQVVLRMSSSSDNASNLAVRRIYATSGIAYLQEGYSPSLGEYTGVPQRLNTDRVRVDELTFAKRANTPGHNSVDVRLTISFNSPNIQKRFSQILQTAVTRVSAATFDSNLMPAANNQYTVGSQGNRWTKINDIIYFQDYLSVPVVGIGQSSPQARLDVYALGSDLAVALSVQGTSTLQGNVTVTGGVRIAPTTSHPSNCDSANAGTIWVNPSTYYLKACLFDGTTLKWMYLVATTTAPY